MKFVVNRILSLCLSAFLLCGCVTTKNVELSNQFWKERDQKIALVIVKPPTPSVYKIGEQGVIDIVINSAMNSKLSNHLKNIELQWYYNSLPSAFEKKLKRSHFAIAKYDVQEAVAEKNYARLLASTDSDLLLLIQLNAIGVQRNYFGFIPTSDPKGYCALEGQLIDVKNNNKVLWRYATSLTQPITGPWKQPPTYPNVTDSIETATEVVQKELMDSFFSEH
jgi:hypothetical protein